MRHKTALFVLALLLGLLFLVYFYYPPVSHLDAGPYDSATVTVTDSNGTELATVDVRIADDREKRLVGLSRTDSLAVGRGMLFVHDDEGTHEYVMRNMSFALDIVFIDADGRITTIHHADPSDDRRFSGQGKYVLEVPRGWANETGVEPGDRVEIPDSGV